MAKKYSRKLVVDASVARSSGDLYALNPAAVSCRDILQIMLGVCHQVVLNRSLQDEWRRHASRFARTWLVQMTSRRKVAFVQGTGRTVQAILDGLVLPSERRAALEKDIPLIEAAMQSDKIVLSLDDKAIASFADLVKAGACGPLWWCNPSDPQPDPTSWVRTGAKPDKRFDLARYVVRT